jgi:hypothetical protein
MANEILTVKNYAAFVDESSWGSLPGSPTYFHIPVFKYDVRMRPQRRNARPFIGLRQRKHGQNFRGQPGGQVLTALYGWHPGTMTTSAAEYLMTWAFGNPETQDLPSKVIEWAEGPNIANKRHLGLRVNSAVCFGSADAGYIGLALDLLGKDEAGNDVMTTAQTLPADRDKLVEFQFTDITCTLNGAEVKIRDFQLSVQNGLVPEYLNSTRPTLMGSGDSVAKLKVTFPKNADTYDAYRRLTTMTEFAGELVLQGLHNGTGGVGTDYAVGTVTLARLSYADHQDELPYDRYSMQPIEFDVLKPDTSSNGIAIAWTEV